MKPGEARIVACTTCCNLYGDDVDEHPGSIATYGRTKEGLPALIVMCKEHDGILMRVDLSEEDMREVAKHGQARETLTAPRSCTTGKPEDIRKVNTDAEAGPDFDSPFFRLEKEPRLH